MAVASLPTKHAHRGSNDGIVLVVLPILAAGIFEVDEAVKVSKSVPAEGKPRALATACRVYPRPSTVVGVRYKDLRGI